MRSLERFDRTFSNCTVLKALITSAEVKARYAIPVIKAFAIRNSADLEKLAPYKGIADRFLLDAKAPEGSDLPGGNGVSFDWNLLKKLDQDTDYMLSGGLGHRQYQ